MGEKNKLDFDLAILRICMRLSMKYSVNEDAIIMIANKIMFGYKYTIQDVRNITELGIPFMELRSELSKLKQTHMETENKNERTYWVIGSIDRAIGTFGPHYIFGHGSWSSDKSEATKFNSCDDAENYARFIRISCSWSVLKVTEPIYKEGDILRVAKSIVIIFDKYDPEADRVYTKAFLSDSLDVSNSPFHGFEHISGFATESQKQRLFDALEKEGKRWNAEKKIVEDINKLGSVSFTIELNQESVDRLMGEMDKMRKCLLDSKKKAEELFKKIQELANPKLSEMDQFKKYLEDDYEISDVTQTAPTFAYSGTDGIVPKVSVPSKLIVTYKPRRK